MVRVRKFTEDRACQLFSQMLQAVDYIHDKGIVHRDLKPENFLFENESGTQIKLIDFGLSKIPNSDSPLNTVVGTP